MTTLLAWVGVDSRVPSSLNFASDSRLSWPNGDTWDFGRKLFASSIQPDIFGYCGEAFFPSQALSQVTDLINLGVVCVDVPDERCNTIRDLLQASIANYPQRFRARFSILYGTRIGVSTKCTFHLFLLNFNGTSFEDPMVVQIPDHSINVISLGSGKMALDNSLNSWSRSDWGGTSRGMFAAFCDTLTAGADPLSGGSPQLISLHGIGAAKHFGIYANGRPSICGITPHDSATLSAVSWYNEHLERYDGLEPAADANPHPRPLSC